MYRSITPFGVISKTLLATVCANSWSCVVNNTEPLKFFNELLNAVIDSNSKMPSDLTPGLVKRVHKLYEELGREDVQAVQDWEKAERETRKDEAKAEHKPDKKD